MKHDTEHADWEGTDQGMDGQQANVQGTINWAWRDSMSRFFSAEAETAS